MTPVSDEEGLTLKHVEQMWHRTEQALGISAFCRWILYEHFDLNRQPYPVIMAVLQDKLEEIRHVRKEMQALREEAPALGVLETA